MIVEPELQLPYIVWISKHTDKLHWLQFISQSNVADSSYRGSNTLILDYNTDIIDVNQSIELGKKYDARNYI